MARQNIDEKWKTDPRRTALAARIGGRAADGMRVEVNWLLLDHKGQPVPLKVFKYVECWQEWVDCGLAEVCGDVVRIAGADEYADFFEKQRLNSIKGGQAMRQKAEAKKSPLAPAATPDEPKDSPKSPSFSFSSSVSKKRKNTKKEELPILQSAPPGENPVAVYCEQWKAKTGQSFTVRPKNAGQLSKLGEDLGPEKAAAVIRAYFAMPNPYYLRRGYSIDVLLNDLAAIQQFMATGKVVTGAVIHELEKRVDKAQGTGHRRKLTDLAPELDATPKLEASNDG